MTKLSKEELWKELTLDQSDDGKLKRYLIEKGCDVQTLNAVLPLILEHRDKILNE